jgi:hypothetical protein
MLALWLLACAGDDSAATEDSAPVDSGTEISQTQTYDPTWDGMQAFFGDHCDSCHPATNGIELRDTLDTYVVPGDPENSRLWISVTGQSLSTMMPPSGRLPQETIEHVEAWIQAGAVR